MGWRRHRITGLIKETIREYISLSAGTTITLRSVSLFVSNTTSHIFASHEDGIMRLKAGLWAVVRNIGFRSFHSMPNSNTSTSRQPKWKHERP
jgi:hypothetical protein